MADADPAPGSPTKGARSDSADGASGARSDSADGAGTDHADGAHPDPGGSARPDDPAALARIARFTQAFARHQGERCVEVPGGFAILHARYPASYDHNKLVITLGGDADPAPALLLATADAVLGGAGLTHRMVVTNGAEPDRAVIQRFLAAGYQHEINLVMRHLGTPPDHPADPAVRVEAVPADALRAAGWREWREWMPDLPEESVRQLVERRVTRLAGARTSFLAVRAADGEVLAHADLYLDPSVGVCQIEDLVTGAAYRGRGYARAIVLDGLRRSGAAGCDLSFLVADAADWPHRFYARLGFAAIGRWHAFTRPAAGAGE